MSTALRSFVRYERDVCLRDLDARRRYVCVRRPGLRFYVVETRGMTFESRVFAQSPGLWPVNVAGPSPVGQFSVSLDGVFITRHGDTERAVMPGAAIGDSRFWWDERWEGSPFRLLCVEWSSLYGKPLAAPSDVGLGASDVARLAALADAIDDGTVDDLAIAAGVRVLRAVGVPLAALDPEALTPAPSNAVSSAAALSRLHTQLDRHPDLGDVEAMLGVSSRQFRRRLCAHPDWSVTPSPEWRATLRRTRVMLAPSLATVRGATVERIAAALGYRSARALLFALDAEGVPSPTVSRRLALG